MTRSELRAALERLAAEAETEAETAPAAVVLWTLVGALDSRTDDIFAGVAAGIAASSLTPANEEKKR